MKSGLRDSSQSVSGDSASSRSVSSGVQPGSALGPAMLLNIVINDMEEKKTKPSLIKFDRRTEIGGMVNNREDGVTASGQSGLVGKPRKQAICILKWPNVAVTFQNREWRPCLQDGDSLLGSWDSGKIWGSWQKTSWTGAPSAKLGPKGLVGSRDV